MKRVFALLIVASLVLASCTTGEDSVSAESSFCPPIERTNIDFSVLNDVKAALSRFSVFQDLAQDDELVFTHTFTSLFRWLGVPASQIPQWAHDIVDEELSSSRGKPNLAALNKVYERLVEDPQYSDLKDPARVEELIEVLINGAIDALNDPFADYIPADVWQAGVNDQHLDGSFTGFGVTLGTNSRDEISVTSVMSGTPAEKGGLRNGDAIIEVNGLSTAECSNRQFSLQLRALEDPRVEFLVARERIDSMERDMVEVVVTKDEIKLVDIATYPGVELPDNRGNTSDDLPYNCGTQAQFGRPCPFDDDDGNPEVLYIKLKAFSRQMYFDLEYFLNNIDQTEFKSVVLDLRDNGGGWPAHCPHAPDRYDTCIEAPNLFMSTDDVIRVQKSASGVVTKTRGTPGLNWLDESLPMTILMNDDSASASEGLAAALRDNGRAIIVNADTRSHGKGMSSRFLDLRQGTYGGLKVSVAFFLTPKGEMIEKMDTNGDGVYDAGGLPPDIHVPWSNRDYTENGRDVNFDPTLNAALEWLKEQLNK